MRNQALAGLTETLALKQELLAESQQSGPATAEELEELQRALEALETSVRETGRERDECLIELNIHDHP